MDKKWVSVDGDHQEGVCNYDVCVCFFDTLVDCSLRWGLESQADPSPGSSPGCIMCSSDLPRYH